MSSRVNDVAKPAIPASSSATQQPPGSVSRKCAVRATQTDLRDGGRSSGTGNPGRCVRTSSS